MSGAPFHGHPKAHIADPTVPAWTVTLNWEHVRVRDLLDDLAIAVAVLHEKADEGRDDALLVETMEAMMAAFVTRMEAEDPPY